MIIISVFFIFLGFAVIYITVKERINWFAAQDHKLKGWVAGLGSLALGIRMLVDVIFHI
jgi:hypothetical protein